jgi:hypothetical protein
VLPLKNRVIRDSAVQLGLTHQRGASGVDSPGRIGVQGCGDAAGSVAAGAGAAVDPTVELARLLSHNDYTAAFNNAHAQRCQRRQLVDSPGAWCEKKARERVFRADSSGDAAGVALVRKGVI